MLYMEDYLEMIEHLPHELKDRFFEMREMDLQVQNSVDMLKERVRYLFNNSQKTDEEREKEYKEIRRAYMKSLETADEKVQMATSFHDMVVTYLKRLDAECHKFKMELEADNRGITEILEKRSLELDQPSGSSSQKENLCVRSSMMTDGRRIIRRDSSLNDRHRASDRALEDLPITAQASSLPGYNLAHIGAGGNAIAAAASQAIAATQHMQQGRRTASLKASYEAINTGVHAHELSIGRELAGAAHTALQASNHEAARKQKKMAQAPVDIQMEEATVADNEAPEDWNYDPEEPRYCICRQVSYGDMVACDYEGCQYEWFHYPCVNMTCPPKGKWYCPGCTNIMRRRGHRKN